MSLLPTNMPVEDAYGNTDPVADALRRRRQKLAETKLSLESEQDNVEAES